MSGKAQTNWLATVLVAGICTAIGFGAVYVMTGGGDNQARLAGGGEFAAGGSVSGRESAGATTGDAGKAAGKPVDRAAGRAEEKRGADEGGARATAAASGADSAFRGPNGEPLNRGAMTTFVFKKTPMELPDGVTFNDKAGQAVGLDQFAGKVVLLNRWATWCAPCR